MSNKKYAFIDEFGAFGYDFDNPGCTTHFLICAVIVDESNLSLVAESVETIRKKYFQQGEIKSSKIGRNHKRRVSILTELKQLPFHIFAFVCDKRKIYENSGLRYKTSFYKFLNNIVHQELRISYSNLTITADEVKQQIAVLNYLLCRFRNKSPRKYIPTQELITQLVYLGYDKLSLQTFRNKIIAKLRDNEVIISSSSGGYKIPSTEKELYDFVNHGKSIIMPMLARLKTCNDVIRMGTNGEINLFEKAEYHSLAKMFGTTEL